MLDFIKLAGLIQNVGMDALGELDSQKELLDLALKTFDQACHDPEFAETLEKNRDKVLWPLLRALTDLDYVADIGPEPTGWTVVACDGSQIMPSHHEVHSCYLLNAGVARISYGLALEPALYSEPRLYARPDDLYPLVDRRRIHIDELFVALERSLFELTLLVEVAEVASATGGGKILTMVDGSLIPWSLEKMPRTYIADYMERVAQLMARLRLAHVPLVGYVSQSRSADLINALRVFLCPYDESRCASHCGHLNEEAFACSSIWPLSDRAVFGRLLVPGQHSAVFASGASAVKLMDDVNATCFTYIKGPDEVARLELPRWVYDDKALFDFALRATYSQVSKGFGYPVALAEAHHLAVIKGPERERFFALLKDHMIALGAHRVAVSPKESRKRTSFI